MEEKRTKSEHPLKGIGVSPGIVVCKARFLARHTEKQMRYSISADDIPFEIARFEEALIATHDQIKHIQKQVAKELGDEHVSIFDAHVLVVDDRTFIEDVIRTIKKKLINVEQVLQSVASHYAETLSKVNDSYLSERAMDIRDVTKRILANLSGKTFDRIKQISEPCIVVAHDLSPSDAVSINKTFVKAFVTDTGSATSHTATIAKALEIPAVVGLHNLSSVVHSGDTLLIDGAKGLVFVHPTEQRLNEYRKRTKEQKQILSELNTLRDKPSETKDGYQVPITANIELLEELESVKERRAKGIGLFRTEFLFLGDNILPDEDAQTETYTRAAKSLYPAPVVIRTLDLGADKLPNEFENHNEKNPFLGDRAIRLCLSHPELFKTQIRAILRASVHDNVRIMYPLVSCVQELLEANSLLRCCMAALSKEGVPFNPDILIGTMIEVPSAALVADIIAPHVNFFSLGTNDLIQYTLAVDRGNENVVHLYKPTHMAIVRLIDQLVKVSHKYGLWTSVCGQMAASPQLVPLLIGLGVDELSVSPPQVPLIKDVIRKLHYSRAVELAHKALHSPSAEHVQQICRNLIAEIAPELLDFSD